jgi:NADP-dependent alcohol dehydrogenase
MGARDQITEGADEERIEMAIGRTRALFERLGVGTRLADYGVDASTAADTVAAQLIAHGKVALCEHGDVTPETARTIVARR